MSITQFLPGDFARLPLLDKHEIRVEPHGNATLAIAKAKAILAETSDEIFFTDWTMRNGDQVYFTMPKVAVMRSFVMNHIIHHRGQLTVYLRLNDIPVPGMYGPSGDEG